MDTASRAALTGLPVAAVYEALTTAPGGLTGAEAQARLYRWGPNILQEAPRRPLLLSFLANFTHLMACLLWAAGLAAFVARMPQLGIAIWAVNLINGIFSFGQEYKAEKATAALRRMLPAYARVLRDGEECRILARDVVPGDVMLLAEGDHVSADARIVDRAGLRVDESALTGESRPVPKVQDACGQADSTDAEPANLVFAGSSIVSGSGIAVAFATGMSTEFGKIARLTQIIPDEPSPLQRELNRLTRTVTALAIGIGLIFFLLSVLLIRVDLADGFLFAIGMIVAFVPEGMLPTVTLSLAMGVQRMAGRNALVKRLSAVETLGCTTVICTDKTGTLTQNEMTVHRLWLADRRYTVTGTGYAPRGEIRVEGSPEAHPLDEDVRLLIAAAALCNNAHLQPPNAENPNWTIRGDPTEAALLTLAGKCGLDPAVLSHRTPRIQEIPFDPYRKRMSTVHHQARERIAYTKGAPGEVLACCAYVHRDGADASLDEKVRRRIEAAIDDYARDGLRVLAVAQRSLPDSPNRYESDDVECGLTFIGLIAMFDPPRPDVAEAVQRCHRAGIRIVMITGDYGLTAECIARRIGIVQGSGARVLSGRDLDALSDESLKAALRDEIIFARVAPEHKLRVVTLLKEMGDIVAVTGDGVNDAPALKRADIGVAMGRAGTDVAQEAADMILTDDHFATIVNAIEEGRAVYDNIRKFALYIFNSNMAEAVPFMAMLLSRGRIPLPLTVLQVLAIDLGTDMVPAIGLGAERPEAGTMDRPPRPRSEPLLTAALLTKALLWYGLFESVAALSAYFFLNGRYGWPGVPLAAEGTHIYRMATTITLAGVVAAQAGFVFACRTERTSLFRIGLFTNGLVLAGVAIEIGLLLLLTYLPLLQDIFYTAPLEWQDWAFVFAWPPLLFLADELRKAFVRTGWGAPSARKG